MREHQELVFISQNGMVQRTSVRGINRYGRASQGVRVMNIRDDDQVSAVALVVESEAQTAAPCSRTTTADLRCADGESMTRRSRAPAASTLAGDDAPARDAAGATSAAGGRRLPSPGRVSRSVGAWRRRSAATRPPASLFSALPEKGGGPPV